jgi:serine/threonine-protein phosphatase 6 regulatory ankyrin repeat subunit B
MDCSAGSGSNGVSVSQTLLDAGASLSVRGRGGVSTLSVAAYYGEPDIVRFLLKRGADVNERAEDGLTPLMAAVQHGHHATIHVLLDYGADLNAQTNDGRNALNYADLRCEPCGTTALLLAAGAEPALVD